MQTADEISNDVFCCYNLSSTSVCQRDVKVMMTDKTRPVAQDAITLL